MAIALGFALFRPRGETQQGAGPVKIFAEGVKALLSEFIVRIFDQLLQSLAGVGNPAGNICLLYTSRCV